MGSRLEKIIAIKREISKKYYRVPPLYLQLPCFTAATLLLSWLLKTQPSFAHPYIGAPLTDLIINFAFIDFIFTGAFFLIGSAGIIFGIMMGIVIATARKNDWRSVIIYQIRRILRKGQHTGMNRYELQAVFNEAIEETLGNYDIPTKKKIGESLSEAFKRISMLEVKNEELETKNKEKERIWMRAFQKVYNELSIERMSRKNAEAKLEERDKLIKQLLSEQSKTETEEKDAQTIEKDNRFESI